MAPDDECDSDQTVALTPIPTRGELAVQEESSSSKDKRKPVKFTKPDDAKEDSDDLSSKQGGGSLKEGDQDKDTGRRETKRDSLGNIWDHILNHSEHHKRAFSVKQFIFFLVSHVVVTSFIAYITYVGGKTAYVSLATVTGMLQAFYIHSAFVSQNGNLFASQRKNFLFIGFITGLAGVNFMVWSIGDIKALEAECGYSAYYDKLRSDRRVNIFSLVGNLCLPAYTMVLYFAWRKHTRSIAQVNFLALVQSKIDNDQVATASLTTTSREIYLTEDDANPTYLTFPLYHNIYDSKPMHYFFIGGILFTAFGSILSDVGLQPRSNANIFFTLTFFVLLFTCFILDSSMCRMRLGQRLPRNNTAYLYTCSSTLLVALTAMVTLRNYVLESHGAIASSVVVSLFTSILCFLFKSLAVRGSTASTCGPFVFPVYYLIDLTQVYLFVAVPFMSVEFWLLLLTQELMSGFRNIGGIDMLIWFGYKLMGMNRKPPFRDKHLLDKLSTNAAADTMAEMLAALTLFILLASAKIGRATGHYACMFEPRSEICTDNEYDLGNFVLTIMIVATSRVGFFFAEKVLFLSMMASLRRALKKSPSVAPLPPTSSASLKLNEGDNGQLHSSTLSSGRLSFSGRLSSVGGHISSLKIALGNLNAVAEYGKVFRSTGDAGILYITSAAIAITAMVCNRSLLERIVKKNEIFFANNVTNCTDAIYYGDNQFDLS
mmetsp:Transcript_10318/g.21221  ORF Transcript_10318/g.21221 Transcript_10318/m.21221 type:complete len:715 (-) Transcript_10318:19-2163(-)